MSVTSGFFNSVNGDRKYNAEQMSAIFDGVINDGIFANIGTAFTVSASTNYDITVGIGRAWFNSAWIYNDAILPMTLEQPEVVLDRIDAVVIEVDHTAAVRAGNIKIVKGTPASTPQNPTMTHTNYVNQYPLAYIYRTAGSSSITQSNITSRIGTSDAPYITGILQVQNIDNIVAQWGAQWIEWYAATTNLGETEMQEMLSQWNSWYSNLTTTSEAQISSWMTMMQGDFESWFEDLQVILDGDVATALAARLLALEEKFDTLAKERAIYVPIEDSDNEGITDSVGRAIEGKTVFVSNSDEELARVETLLNGHIQDDSVHIITLIHEKTGTVHTLAGIPSGLGIFTAQFKATARFSYGDTFSDGYTAKPTGLDASLQDGAFVSGDVVTVTIDTEGKKLNFKLGGGVNDTLPPLNPNMTGELADGVFTVTADKLPVSQADALAGAEWYYGDHVPARPGDGTKVEFTREQLITGAPEGKAASEYNAGDIVTIKENGSPVEFICLKHGYPTLDNGMTLFYRKNIYSILDSITGISPDYDYTGSTLDTYMEATYKAVLSPYVRNIIQPVNIAVRTGKITRSIFPLSNGELGDTSDPVIGNAIAYFASDAQRISNYGSSPAQYATRLFNSYGVISVCCVTESGAFRRIAIGSLSNVGVRPAFVLPSSTLFSAYTNELIEDATAGVQTLADTTNLGDETEGSIVTLQEDGAAVEFYVAKQNYEATLNGEGRVLLVRKDCYDSRAWDSDNQNALATSDIDTFFNGDYKAKFSSAIQSLMGTTKIYYTPGMGDYSVGEIQRSIFQLSLTELGLTNSAANVEGSALPIASTLRFVYLSDQAVSQWTRTPNVGFNTNVWRVNEDGAASSNNCNLTFGSRPCFTLPANMQVNSDGSIVEADPDSPVVTATIPWTSSSYIYVRQFPYNAKHQYQTQLVGGVATTDPDYQDGSIPSEPEDDPENFDFYQIVTQTQEWSPQSSGWYNVYCVGGCGSGASGTRSERQGNGGPGGGSGAIARSILFLKTSDIIQITINTSLTSFGDYMSCTAGANGDFSSLVNKQYLGGVGGTANGGNKENLNGFRGGSGGQGYDRRTGSNNKQQGWRMPGTQGENNGALGGPAGAGSTGSGGGLGGMTGGGGGGARLPSTKYTIESLTDYTGGTGAYIYQDDENNRPGTNGSVYPNSFVSPPVLYGGGNGGGGGATVSWGSQVAGTGSAGTPGCIIIEKTIV